MSGIFGVWHLDRRPVARSDLRLMREALRARGPDASDIWTLGETGFGQCIFATTPKAAIDSQLLAMEPSSGRIRPAGTDPGDLVLVADARIDNRVEISQALGIAIADRRRVRDAELVLRAYARWGADCPDVLRGDFAFAIWDPHEKRLFCARDPMGVKPFCYYHRPGRTFAFASQTRGLLAHPQVPREIEPAAVAMHIRRRADDREITLYRAIRRLPAAHAGYVTPERLRFRRYWDLEGIAELKLGSSDQYADAFRCELEKAVQARTRCNALVGTTLSGGLDSSTIACMARDAVDRKPLHAFSAVFPGLGERARKVADERRFIEAVLEQGGIAGHLIEADRLGPLDDIEADLKEQDGAHLGGNLYLHRALYRAAADEGVGVVLEGTDGDTTVGYGYEYLVQLARLGDWRSLTTQVGALANRTEVSPEAYLARFARPSVKRLLQQGRLFTWVRAARGIHRELKISYGRLAVTYGLAGIVPSALEGWVRGAISRPWEATPTKWIDPDFERRVDLPEEALGPVGDEGPAEETARTLHRASVMSPLIQWALEASDRLAASSGIQVRYPFCDRNLIELCIALPPEERLQAGWTRSVHRRATIGLLPDVVRTRSRKQQLAPATILAMRNSNRQALDRAMREDLEVLRPYADVPTVLEVHRRFVSDHGIGAADAELACTLFQVVTLARWLKAEGEGAGQARCRNALAGVAA